MKMPDKKFTLQDKESRIDYVVYAYRNLTRAEVLAAVRTFRTTAAGRRVKSGHTYEIITTIGALE